MTISGHAKLVNLTPHSVKLLAADGSVKLEVPPSGEVARVSESNELAGNVLVDGKDVRIYSVKTGEVSGLPPKAHGVLYIVSRAVAAASDRDDLVVPYPLIRDKNGRIIGAGGLAMMR